MKQEELFSQRELEQAAAATAEAMLDALPAAQEERLFSPAFQENMAALLHREHRRAASRRRSRWAAALVLVCLAGAAVWTASQAQARGGAAAWARQVFQNSIVYNFSGAASDQALPSYRLSWLPEGYQQTQRYEHPSVVSTVYQNSRGEALIFTYLHIQKSSAAILPFAQEEYVCKTVEIAGQQADLYLPLAEEEPAALVWVEEDILFSLSGRLTEGELVDTAESVLLEEMEG
ncbi:MAG: DUF4367 domain-containing protein [Oscillospiraceae bacterium]|nr:DUF4367 domain-containing protein [Oscillospiraceae bacterium]